ncbi:transposase [Chryseobacterium sp. G0186]|uniref:REP-associated tyrosine transposase n=1 Tax=Chryseobacterium sp. G0186 TaxID=2487064 RepID=UPI000F4EAEB8|nr:transposase [Chryseobacterium sp. G0186]AZA78664.1 transposase [Chryseobacterium sp. G0186]
MSFAYKIYDQQGVYFVTCTVHQWVDVFTRDEYKNILVDSLKYCQKEKGLKIYVWVIMTNHIHLIIGTSKDNLSDILRDFKKFTSKQIFNAISNHRQESRKHWMLWLLTKGDGILFWQEGYHGEEIRTIDFYRTKECYIHLNPVRAGIVAKEEEYVYSSCATRYGLTKGMLELEDY